MGRLRATKQKGAIGNNMAKRKLDSKSFAQQRRKKRRTLTFLRMVRYGVNNFSRNAWLTIAATAVMTITLLIVFVSFASRNILTDTVSTLKDRVDMSIYLDTTTPDDAAGEIVQAVNKLESVRRVTYISPEQARAEIVEDNKQNPKYLEALNEATNMNPGVVRVNLIDINDTAELEKFVAENELLVKYIDPDRAPSFAGERKKTIQGIGQTVQFAERAGIISAIVFVAISSLIIFNTIRMAIFNRREEIYMMKLIGAERSFIRGPFLVEAVMYGFIAAIIATGLGVFGLYAIADPLAKYEITVEPTYTLATTYVPFLLVVMILIGASIGIVSSLMATRRYLKI